MIFKKIAVLLIIGFSTNCVAADLTWNTTNWDSSNWHKGNNGPYADNDSDGFLNKDDLDDDNDSVADIDDGFPYDPSESTDNDSDGIGDNADTDDDNDGVLDVDDEYPLIYNMLAQRGLPVWLLKAAKEGVTAP